MDSCNTHEFFSVVDAVESIIEDDDDDDDDVLPCHNEQCMCVV